MKSRDEWLLRAALLLGFIGVGLTVYEPALDGQFVSDDAHYVANNPYIQDPSREHLVAILDPTSIVPRLVENYEPVHLLANVAQWQLFGEAVRGYHVVNVVLHAIAALLLALLLERCGVPRIAAWLGAGLFLVHPANAPVASWISQQKTSGALAFALGAALAFPRRPAIGTLLFALGLLTKPQAAVAVFFVAALGWVRRDARGRETPAERWPWAWVAACGLVLAAFTVVEMAAFRETAGRAPPIYPELDVRLRSVLAVWLRYLWMTASGQGLSAFHEPPASESWLDPWWLGSLAIVGLLAWRTLAALRERRVEAAFWLWAAVSFGPISGVIPLPFPMADRYLYFILPGLIGALTCVLLTTAPRVVPRLEARGLDPEKLRSPARWVGIVVALAVLAAFGARAHERSRVFRSNHHLMLDAATNYPDGTAAHTRRAHRAAMVGDARTAVASLRVAVDRGYNRLDHLLEDPAYLAIRGDPGFQALLREVAQEWLDRLGKVASPIQLELRLIAQAHIVVEDYEAALAALERAVEIGGPADAEARQERDMVRRIVEQQRREAAN